MDANPLLPDDRSAGPPKLDADVIIVGSGPAGMSAAIELSGRDCKVIVLDMNAAPGGQIYRAVEANLGGTSNGILVKALGSAYAHGWELAKSFRSAKGIDYRPNTTVWEVRTDGTVGWLSGSEGGFLRARHVILANGAMERPTPFPGWTLSGVMTAGAVQTLIKSGRLKPTGRIALAGTGPLLFLLANQLMKLGVKPVLIARTDRLTDKLTALPRLRLAGLSPLIKGAAWMLGLRMAGVPMLTAIKTLEAAGQDKLEEIVVSANGRTTRLPCDLLIVHDGIIPSIDLAHGAGLNLDWIEPDGSWRPASNRNGLTSLADGPAFSSGENRTWLSGDARMIGGAEAAAAHGRHVGQRIADLVHGREAADHASPAQPDDYARAMSLRPFIDTAFPPGLATMPLADNTIVCRCEEISAGQVRACAAAGAPDMDQLRGILRCGMGPCQGRSCSTSIARLLDEMAISAKPPRPFRARPPIRPIPLEVLARLQSLDPALVSSEALADKPDMADEDASHV